MILGCDLIGWNDDHMVASLQTVDPNPTWIDLALYVMFLNHWNWSWFDIFCCSNKPALILFWFLMKTNYFLVINCPCFVISNLYFERKNQNIKKLKFHYEAQYYAFHNWSIHRNVRVCIFNSWNFNIVIISIILAVAM